MHACLQVVFYEYIKTATCVRLEDPWIQAYHQLNNYVRFCELLVRVATGLKRVELVTKTAEARFQE